MSRIVTIQFITAGKLYDFNAGDLDIAPGDKVIVETERGLGLGSVVSGPVDRKQGETPAGLATIRRKATPEDLVTLERNIGKEKEAYEFCLRRIMERGMQMKLVRVEYLFDGSKAVFFFTADGRVDFRDLVKDLAHTFHTRIEMRQIGVRDESKMVGGIGICGRELCCCSFLRDFQPVSVKMAKEQNLALNPNKISGQCGRLLCCLDYEYETYCCLRKNLPKCGKRVRTESTAGVVDKLNILTGDITLKTDDGKHVVVKQGEVLGEAAPVDTQPRAEPASATTARPSQKGRAQRPERTERPERPERTERKSAEAAAPQQEAPPAAPPVVQSAEEPRQSDGQPRKGRKKNRFRKHGHRKDQDGTPNGSTPPPAPGA
ncbi:MAG: stage 0 sporulation family protein [Deltaproteobacteria bacterium]|nr:stage 0 sporulation family protein [Deltaproteobacteria bacterium]